MKIKPLKLKPLEWTKNGEILTAQGVNCIYVIRPERHRYRLRIADNDGRPLLTDFDTYEQAMTEATADTKRRLRRFIHFEYNNLKDNNFGATND